MQKGANMADSHVRAVLKYYEKNKSRIHRVSFTLYDSKDPELWLWLESRAEGKGVAIQRLIREEIDRTGWKPKRK